MTIKQIFYRAIPLDPEGHWKMAATIFTVVVVALSIAGFVFWKLLFLIIKILSGLIQTILGLF